MVFRNGFATANAVGRGCRKVLTKTVLNHNVIDTADFSFNVPRRMALGLRTWFVRVPAVGPVDGRRCVSLSGVSVSLGLSCFVAS
jgi:hypothetical protein